MSSRDLRVVAASLALLQGLACGAGSPKGQTRDQVLALLTQEAESLKKEGERLDPALGVAATWKVEAVEVSERPGDAAKPWNGTIRFGITSASHDPDGSRTSDRFEKSFQYAFDAASNRWQMR